MMQKIFENEEMSVSMADAEELPVMGLSIVEAMLNQSVEDYEENGDFEEFKTPLVASLSPVRFKILKIACEELTTSRKDYHIVMSFLESIEKIATEKAEEVRKEMEE